MFEFILRRTTFKNLRKESLSTVMLLKSKIKLRLISYCLVYLFGIIPIVLIIALLSTSEYTIAYFVLLFTYSLFASYFVVNFDESIKLFINAIFINMYWSRYILKGNAISMQDFEIIEKENEEMYNCIMLQQVHGFCYSVCFNILKCLKKGTIFFIAIRDVKFKNEDENEDSNEYTMHVLYVNNNWCYDTYTERQYPLEYVMKQLKTKNYATFSYEDVAEKTYDEFRKEQYPALKEWCYANDCSEKWLDVN